MPLRGNIVRFLRHPRASDGRRQLVDHLRSGLGPAEEGMYLEPMRVRGRGRLGTRSKMRMMVMNTTTKLAPDPIYILGVDLVLNLLDGRLSVLSWRIQRT